MGIKQGATKVVSREANDLFIIWRNYITVACGVGDWYVATSAACVLDT